LLDLLSLTSVIFQLFLNYSFFKAYIAFDVVCDLILPGCEFHAVSVADGVNKCKLYGFPALIRLLLRRADPSRKLIKFEDFGLALECHILKRHRDPATRPATSTIDNALGLSLVELFQNLVHERALAYARRPTHQDV
jgi:hypothetical protein